MDAMEQRFLRILHDRSLVAHGDRVLIALSGGPDSVALLHLFHAVAPALQLHLGAAHLDHGMRLESGADAAFVGELCDRLGIPLTVGRVDVPRRAAEQGTGLEETARAERRAFLQRTAEALGGAKIALGHHRGDQAETVLHRFLRGSGMSGLTAMRAQSGPFIRPLLELSRAELLAYLSGHGATFRSDASNDDCTFTRNRIRHQLLPQLASYNPRLEEHLAAFAARAADEEDFWRLQEDDAFKVVVRSSVDGLELALPALLALHPALRRRVLRRALGEVRESLAGIASVHITSLEELLVSGPPQGELNLPGCFVARRYARLLLRTESPAEAPEWSVTIPGPGTYATPAGTFEVTVMADSAGEGSLAAEFAADSVTFPLTIRTFRPGDRFHPQGAVGGKKLKDFFIDQRIEREIRSAIPLVVGSEVLWLAGWRRCAGHAGEGNSGQVLRMTFRPAPEADKWLVHLPALC